MDLGDKEFVLWPLDGGGSTVKIQGNELQNDVQDP